MSDFLGIAHQSKNSNLYSGFFLSKQRCKWIYLILLVKAQNSDQFCQKANFILKNIKIQGISSKTDESNLLIFYVLHFYEIGTFIPNSSVFIFLMFRTLYRMICKNAKSFFGRNSLILWNVKQFSNFWSQDPYNWFLYLMFWCIW